MRACGTGGWLPEQAQQQFRMVHQSRRIAVSRTGPTPSGPFPSLPRPSATAYYLDRQCRRVSKESRGPPRTRGKPPSSSRWLGRGASAEMHGVLRDCVECGHVSPARKLAISGSAGCERGAVWPRLVRSEWRRWARAWSRGSERESDRGLAGEASANSAMIASSFMRQ